MLASALFGVIARGSVDPSVVGLTLSVTSLVTHRLVRTPNGGNLSMDSSSVDRNCFTGLRELNDSSADDFSGTPFGLF